MAETTSTTRLFYTLDGIRSVAAILVAIYHTVERTANE